MKKLIVVFGIIALFGCEKETCWSCKEYQYFASGLTQFKGEEIYCDAEPKSDTYPGGGTRYDCTLLND